MYREPICVLVLCTGQHIKGSANSASCRSDERNCVYWCGRGDTAPRHHKPFIYGPFPVLSGPALDLTGCTFAKASRVPNIRSADQRSRAKPAGPDGTHSRQRFIGTPTPTVLVPLALASLVLGSRGPLVGFFEVSCCRFKISIRRLEAHSRDAAERNASRPTGR
jgi:hypothetical protein